jgi:hypothetical protein
VLGLSNITSNEITLRCFSLFLLTSIFSKNFRLTKVKILISIKRRLNPLLNFFSLPHCLIWGCKLTNKNYHTRVLFKSFFEKNLFTPNTTTSQ